MFSVHSSRTLDRIWWPRGCQWSTSIALSFVEQNAGSCRSSDLRQNQENPALVCCFGWDGQTRRKGTRQLFATTTDVVKTGLCSGCGVCAALCPTGAISMVEDVRRGVYEPVREVGKCSMCGLCVQICAGHALELQEARIPPPDRSVDGLLWGNARCYVGAAKDRDTRFRGASGGMVTTILMHLLDSGVIDGAIVAVASERQPLRPIMKACRSTDEIRRAATSRYCPVEMSHALRQTLYGDGTYAVVGLPCHINSLVKAQNVLPRLKDTYPLLLGLLCGHTPSFLATDYILRISEIEQSEVQQLSYRGRGWPGGVRVDTRGNRSVFHTHEALWQGPLGALFIPEYCLICADHLNLQADLCFGDAWLPCTSREDGGLSIVIARTGQGQDLLQHMNGKHIDVVRVGLSTISEAQAGFAFARGQPSRALWRRLLRRPVVRHYATVAYDACSVSGVLSGLMHAWLATLSRMRTLWPLLHVLFIVRKALKRTASRP